MKPCIYFEPKIRNDNFEGVRLRKNIKNALEVNNISYSKSIVDTYDIIHFISINDEVKINDALESKIPVIFSALYCESDDCARTLTRSQPSSLSQKALRVLNKVNCVLVSDAISKKYLTNNGVRTKIEIVTPGVNLSRFEKHNNFKEDIFYNYYQVAKNKKYAVSISTSDDRSLIKKLISIAKQCPNILFFHFSPTKNNLTINISKDIPSNLKLCALIDSELYCSMLKNAFIYLLLDNNYHSPLLLLEVMASKTQIVALSPLQMNQEYVEEAKAYVGEDEQEISKIINQLINNELEYKIDDGYKFAIDNSIEVLGKQLINVYKKIIRETKQ